MPHPKNRIKLTGDTHPPELDDILVLEDEPATGETATARETAAPRAPARLGRSLLAGEPAPPAIGKLSERMQFGASAQQRVVAQPLAALGMAFAVGWIFGKLFKH